MTIPKQEEYDPRVDPSRCIGCGLCPEILPEVFRIPHPMGVAVAYVGDGWKPDKADKLEAAATNCPVRAIIIDPNEAVFEDED